jgi:cobalamin biosynthesis protein CobT
MKTTHAIILAALLAAGTASAQSTTPMPQDSNQPQTTDQTDGMANANPSSKAADATAKTDRQAKKAAKKHADTSSMSQGNSGTRGTTNADIDRRGGDADTGAVAPTDAAAPNAAPNTKTPTAPTR